MQTISFCGVGAHHQNGVSENTIKQLTLTARTLLLHAQRYWPEYISSMLWTFALLAAADRMNNLHIDMNGETPEMKFSAASGVTTRPTNFHTFGCPVYVLDARLQDAGGPGVPKWEPRARLGIYVGHSPYHAGSVALVLNPKTGLVSPQFHVVFDDDFSTVPHLRSGTVPENWSELVRHSRQKSYDGFYDVTKTWFEGEQDPSADHVPAGPLPSDSGSSMNSPQQPLDRNPMLPLVSPDEPHEDMTRASGGESRKDLTLLNEFSKGMNESSNDSASNLDDLLTHEPRLESTIDSEGEDYLPQLLFDGESKMPPIVDITTAGLQRTKRV